MPEGSLVPAGPGGLLLLVLALILIGLGVPLPSELTLMLSGVALRQEGYPGYVLIPLVIAAQVIGLSAAYWIGREGGSKIILKHGHVVGLGPKQLRRARRYFRHRGAWVVLGALLIPGVRGCIGYFAGIAHVTFPRFLAAALIGTVLWSLALGGLGYALSEQLPLVIAVAHRMSLLLLLVFLVGGLWYYRARRRPSGRS